MGIDLRYYVEPSKYSTWFESFYPEEVFQYDTDKLADAAKSIFSVEH
jgi:hypothetical protein